MPHYCEITDLTRPHPAVVMIHFQMRDDSTTPHTVIIADATTGFDTILRDASGAIVPETNVQKRQRMRQEFDAYAQRLIDGTTSTGGAFDNLRDQALGPPPYRYPAAT